jgi:hypothetical protein
MVVKPKPKPSQQEKIATAAKALSIAAPSISTGQGKTYEAWVMLEIAAGLKTLGVDIEARNHKNQPTKAFKVRGGPGYIRPASSNKADEPCHFVVQTDWRREWEIHASVKHRGVSGDEHELDVSIIGSRGANISRALPNGAAFKGLRLMALELKEFDAESYLDKGIPRALLGVAVDLDPGVVITGLSVQTAVGAEAWFVGSPSRADYRLLTTAQIRPASIAYLQSYGMTSAAGVTPGNENAIKSIIHDVAMHTWIG